MVLDAATNAVVGQVMLTNERVVRLEPISRTLLWECGLRCHALRFSCDAEFQLLARTVRALQRLERLQLMVGSAEWMMHQNQLLARATETPRHRSEQERTSGRRLDS